MSVNCRNLLQELTSLGVQILPADGPVLVRPAGALTAGVRSALVEHKAALLQLLAEEAREWDPEQACEIVSMTIADVDAEHGAAGYDRTEFSRFNHATAAAFSARSIGAVRAACVAFRSAVDRRMGAASAERPAGATASEAA
jgi:hypothetical protein